MLRKVLLWLAATVVLTSVAVAQQGQAKAALFSSELQTSDPVNSASSTMSGAISEQNAGTLPDSGYDVFRVEQSIGWDGIARRGANVRGNVCTKECTEKCGFCLTCSPGELFDCDSCDCQPI
jgi:hypothetical protein